MKLRTTGESDNRIRACLTLFAYAFVKLVQSLSVIRAPSAI
jgi:hypothetical protein